MFVGCKLILSKIRELLALLLFKKTTPSQEGVVMMPTKRTNWPVRQAIRQTRTLVRGLAVTLLCAALLPKYDQGEGQYLYKAMDEYLELLRTGELGR
jgi:hypothetical protein